MKNYLRNLLSALLGNNPYQTERDELRRQMKQGNKQVASLQQLVENLRERIKDKDAVIAQLQKEYREYTKQAKETTNKS
jgi:peptidoglycan hydrolase CwlO-like protein